jgi:hypothetical protein
MSKSKDKKNNLYDYVGIAIIISFIGFGGYFSFGLIQSFTNEDKSIISDKVWCANCQTYHDKETAEAEEGKLVWCINCKKYHAPGLD